MTDNSTPAAPGAAGKSPTEDTTVRFRLAGRARRLLVLGHVSAALGWLGIDVVIGVLAVTGFLSADPARVAASYLALDAFATPLLLIFGLTTLGTGIWLGLSSRWGVLRYWWVAIKLALNLVLSTLVLVLLAPRLTTAAREAIAVDATLIDRLGQVPLDLLFPAFVSGAALVLAAVLGKFKPWGRTPIRGRTQGNGRAD